MQEAPIEPMAEAVEAAAEWACPLEHRDYESGDEPCRRCVIYAEGQVRMAAPFIAEHIARQIRAQRPAGGARLTFESGIKRAARIACEAFPKGDDHA